MLDVYVLTVLSIVTFSLMGAIAARMYINYVLYLAKRQKFSYAKWSVGLLFQAVLGVITIELNNLGDRPEFSKVLPALVAIAILVIYARHLLAKNGFLSNKSETRG